MEQINIGLVGFGTVGQALYEVVSSARNAHAAVKRICVRSLDKPRKVQVPAELLTTDADDIVNDPDISLVVEVIDNPEAAYRIACDALRAGKDVVSGNKAMIARHLPEHRAAAGHGPRPALRRLVVRLNPRDTQPGGILRQRPAAGGKGHS